MHIVQRIRHKRELRNMSIVSIVYSARAPTISPTCRVAPAQEMDDQDEWKEVFDHVSYTVTAGHLWALDVTQPLFSSQKTGRSYYYNRRTRLCDKALGGLHSCLTRCLCMFGNHQGTNMDATRAFHVSLLGCSGCYDHSTATPSH